MSWPVGTSKVRMTESCDVTRTQRESGEKACEVYEGERRESEGKRTTPTHDVEDAPSRARQFTNDSPRLDVDDADDEVVAHDCEEPVIALEQDRGDGRLERER